jgi:TonB-dependent SusC/RagA subfamily outer membrane receptor
MALAGALLTACAPTASYPTARATPPDPPPGHGSQPERTRTGAVESVRPDAVSGGHVESVEELLEGRVAGLRVIRLANGDVSLRIRGKDSLLGDGEPLLIIDGMPIHPANLSDALRGLNPREVTHIEVLKDISSTAIYGSRGANGVILIALRRAG